MSKKNTYIVSQDNSVYLVVNLTSVAHRVIIPLRHNLIFLLHKFNVYICKINFFSHSNILALPEPNTILFSSLINARSTKVWKPLMKGIIETDYLIMTLQGKIIYIGKDILFAQIKTEFNIVWLCVIIFKCIFGRIQDILSALTQNMNSKHTHNLDSLLLLLLLFLIFDYSQWGRSLRCATRLNLSWEIKYA